MPCPTSRVLGVGRATLAGLIVLAVACGVVALPLPLPATAQQPYAFEWRSFSRLSRVEGGEVVTTQGEVRGQGTATLTALGPDVWRFDFSGPGGSGGGALGPHGPYDLGFPTAVSVGHPPAPPHLTGGSFEFAGDPADPTAFEVSYAEGFICRAGLDACDGVDGWERFFTGRGARGGGATP